jgi:serine/threonine kinase PknH
MSEAAPGSRVGAVFGPYQLRRLLGRGGMGEVYEAYDTVKDRVVALKLMTQELSSDDVFRQRMQREAHTAGRLQEPHVVPIHDYGEIDGHLFIDMRFVEGTDVSKVLRSNGPLPPPRAVAIIRQVASALDAAHRAEIVHRDVKPENILLTGEDFAYLVDFGIAAAVTDQHLTKTGSAVGTWNYMAPERFGAAEFTYRADIYALACVLYECLTGAPPYPSDSLPALMAAHLTQPVPRPSHQNHTVSTAFDDVIARGMAKDPSWRYASAGDLARAAHDALSTTDQHREATLLAHSQHNAPPATVPTPWAQPPWAPSPPRTNRKPLLILGAVVAVFALLAGTGIWLAVNKESTGRQARNAPTTEPIANAPVTTAITTTPAAPPLTPAQLETILLSPADVNSIMGPPDLEPEDKTQLDTNTSTLSMPDCLSAVYGREPEVYAGTGYTAVSAQVFTGGQTLRFVDQTVVAYPSAEQAGAFLQASESKWRGCAGQTVSETGGRPPLLTWTLGPLNGTAPKIWMSNNAKGGLPCQRVLSAVSRVVIDVAVCKRDVGDQGTRIADALATHVPR